MSKKSFQKDSARYYRQKDLWRLLGAGLMIVGVVWFYFGFSMASYYIPGVITPVGLIMFLVCSMRHISDSDVEEERNHRLLDYDRAVTDRADYNRFVLRSPADVETEVYRMDSEAAYFKRGKNSALISDRYVKSHFFFTQDALIVCIRELSMTIPAEEEGGVSDRELILPYNAITSAKLCEHTGQITLTSTQKPAGIKWTELIITGTEGEMLCLPVKNDMDTLGLCDELNRKISQLSQNS